MSRMKVSETDLIRIADIYNTQGKSAAIRVLRDEYNYHNISNMWLRLKSKKLIGNENTTVIPVMPDKKAKADDIFLSIDELCSSKNEGNKKETALTPAKKTVSMEKLIQELIGDRLLEISKYIILNTAEKTMIIDRTTLSNEGYKIIFQ